MMNSLDPGLRRDDVDSGKHAFLDGHYLTRISLTLNPGYIFLTAAFPKKSRV